MLYSSYYSFQAYSELLQTGRLKPNCTDVEPFEVDGHIHLAELSHGLKKHYYWTPSFGEEMDKDANASLAIAPVSENLWVRQQLDALPVLEVFLSGF